MHQTSPTAEPSWVADMRQIAAGIKARQAAKIVPAAPVVVVQPSRAELLAELQQVQQGFDPAYAYSDDHTVFCENANKAARINELRRALAVAA